MNLNLDLAKQYVSNYKISRDEMEVLRALVYEFRQNYSGFFSLVVYKQFSRLFRMLDRLEAIEENIFNRRVITEETGIEELEKMQYLLNKNVESIFEQLYQIAQNVNMRQFFLNNSEFVDKIAQKIMSSDDESSKNESKTFALESNVLTPSGRQKVNNILNQILQN